MSCGDPRYDAPTGPVGPGSDLVQRMAQLLYDELGALRAASDQGAQLVASVTDAASEVSIAPGRYWVHLESGDAGVTVCLSLRTGITPLAAAGGPRDGCHSFPGGTVAFVEVPQGVLKIGAQLAPSGATASKLHFNRAPAARR